MGGDSSLEDDFPVFSSDSPSSFRSSEEFCGVEFDYNLRRRKNAYNEIMKNYDEFSARKESLLLAKSKILRYTPGSWINEMGGKKLSNYVIPKMTTLLLVGPRGSGKSSLVNQISRVFEDDKFASERAQVTYSSSGEGTFFLGEYMIPRGASSFCLFDTRSLSEDFSDNEQVLKNWMTKGVRHGELVTRRSDGFSQKMVLKCKARQSGSCTGEIRKVNFVIFVVNGFSVLRSMTSDRREDINYVENLVKTFNCPYLSFKDDKPVVAVTHGDLLSLGDRARVRVYLGEKLGVPPAKQIFDIPENSDPGTELTIIDMIRYSLEHADKNLLCRELNFWLVGERTAHSDNGFKVGISLIEVKSLALVLLVLLILSMVFLTLIPRSSNHHKPLSTSASNWYSATNHSDEKQAPQTKFPPLHPDVDRFCKKYGYRPPSTRSQRPKSAVKWHKIRHIW